jgi:hypothetical protein
LRPAAAGPILEAVIIIYIVVIYIIAVERRHVGIAGRILIIWEIGIVGHVGILRRSRRWSRH